MVDSIGLGEFLANFIILFLGLIGLIGYFILAHFRHKYAGFLWISVLFNAFIFLYFMGTLHTYVLNFSIYVWPVINLASAIFLFLKPKK